MQSTAGWSRATVRGAALAWALALAGCGEADELGEQTHAAEQAVSCGDLVVGGVGYPVGDRATHPAGGWQVWQVLAHHWPAWGGRHLAQDVSVPGGLGAINAPVYSMADGQVLYAKANGSTYRNVVLIRHPLQNGEYVCSFYGHINTPSVSAGETVSRGQQIATVMDWAVAAGGASSNTHLHYVLLSKPYCDYAASTGTANWSGSGVCGYDKGGPNGVGWNDLSTEPSHYTAVSDSCGAWQFTNGLLSPSQFVESQEQSAGQCGDDGGSGGLAHSLGGSLGSAPALAANADGRLQAFARGSDGALWTIHQTVPNGGWAGWISLGGGILGRPAVAQAADGRIEVFVRGTDHGVYRKAQTAPNGSFGSWISLGGHATSDPTVVQNWDGRLELFAVGTDGRLYHRFQLSQNGDFSNWEPRGSLVGSGLADPVAGTWGGAIPAVAARGNDGNVYAIHLAYDGWSDWTLLGGTSAAGGLGLGQNQDGRLEVFARSAAGNLVHSWETQAGGAWSAWSSLGGVVHDPAAIRGPDGRLSVFVRGAGGDLWRISQIAPNSGWGGWVSIGGSMIGGPAAAQNQDGRLEVFLTGTDGALWHSWESAPGSW